MGRATKVEGYVAPGFESCVSAFKEGLASGAETGAACSITVDGETVVDIWGGVADRRTQRPWERDTIVPVFSVTKGVAAVCVLHLVAEGRLALDAPLAQYWPEFAQAGKERLTVRHALAHRGGVPYVDGPVDLDQLADAEGMAARIAAQTPLFEPGSAHAYHPITVGWLTGELVRRTSGVTIGQWLDANVVRPLGLSLHIGLPEGSRAQVARIDYRDPTQTTQIIEETMVPDTPAWRALTVNGVISFAPELEAGSLNDYQVQRLELAGAGMISDARSLARFYAACIAPVDGVRLMSDEIVEEAIRPVSTGLPFGADVAGPSWGSGVMIPWDVQPMLGGSSFGHDGMGGSLAFADPDTRVSFAYVRNGLANGGFKDPEVYAVVDALRTVLERAA